MLVLARVILVGIDTEYFPMIVVEWFTRRLMAHRPKALPYAYGKAGSRGLARKKGQDGSMWISTHQVGK